MRKLGAERRETSRAKQLAHAEQAFAEQRFDDAAQHFQAALDVVGESPELAARLAEAKDRAHRQQEEALIADLHAGLSEPEGPTSEASLRDYLDFPEKLRAQVRERVGSASVARLLAWLEEAKAPRSGAKAEAAVKAVLALGQNIDILHHGDAQAALDTLAPHRGVLRAIGQARQGLAQARSRVAEEHRERALRTLAAIEASMAQDQVEEAALLLEGLAERDLPAEEQGRVEELGARVRHAETIEMKEHEHANRLAAENFLGARESAWALAEAAGDDARRELWRRRGERLSKRIAKAWQLEVATEPIPLTELASLSPWYLPQEPLICLDATGTELILAEAWESWLFLHVIDVHRQEVRTSVSLRVPEPLGKEPALCVDGRRVLVCGEGMLLELRQGDRAQGDQAQDAWEIVSWRSLRELFPHDHLVKRVGLIPGSDCIWLDVATSAIEWEGEREIHIVDLKTWRLRHQRTGEFFAWSIPIAAPGEIDVVLTGHGLGAALHAARGAKKIGLLVDQPAVSAAIGPSGEGLVVLGSPIPELLEEDEKTGILIFYIESELPGAFSITGNLALELDIEGRNPMLTDLELGLTFLLLQTPELRRYLVAIAASQEGGPEERYRIEVPFETTLVQDRDARHVLAVCRRGLGLEIFRPGPEPPVLAPFPAFLKGADRLLPESGWPFSCDPLDHVDELPEEKELAHLDKAGQAVGLGWWDDALEHLEGIDPRKLDEACLSHFHHLLGLAQLHAGRAQEALATFEKEVPRPKLCNMHALREMVRPMSDPPQPEEWEVDQHLVRQLLGAIRTAEHALASGSAAQALGALNRPCLWYADEVQSVARLAAAHLESAARSPGERFRKRIALAFYCGLEERSRQKEIDFPGLKWEPERLRELHRRARAWLEAE